MFFRVGRCLWWSAEIRSSTFVWSFWVRGECLAKRWHGLRAWWGENEATHCRHMAATSIHPNCTGSKRQKWYLYHLYHPKSRDTNFSNFVSPKKSWYNFLKFCITKKIFKSLKKICIRITRQKFFDTDLIIFNFFQLFREWSNKKNITGLINGHDMIQMIQIQDMSTIAPTPGAAVCFLYRKWSRISYETYKRLFS